MAKVLVVGGAGYVGSAVSAWLIDRGHKVWVLDDLSTGHRELALGEGFTLCRAGDQEEVSKLLKQEHFDGVMHFAALSLVSESMTARDRYFENNVTQTETLLKTLLKHGIRNFVFSSTCAIFGDPGEKPINEKLPKKPINPYGETKLAAERLLEQMAAEHGLRAIALRYFNAAGAEPNLRVGEWHSPESHLIPRVLTAALDGTPVTLFGEDYDTRDGTCVRDYIHVSDLAAAHETAMKRLLAIAGDTGHFEAFNLGTENGTTVREIITAAERITGRKISVDSQPRRPGDPPRLVAESALARRELGFAPSRTIDDIIKSAFNWEQLRRKPRPAVFLDRDGTLNPDPGYISDPALLELFPGVGEGLAALKRAGYALVLVSNQSGVARGLIPPEAIPLLNAKMNDLLRPFGVKLDDIQLCIHHPDNDCACRKPKPELLLNAAKKLNLDLSRSFMIGDKEADILAGRAAGCLATILVRTGHGEKTEAKLRNTPNAPDFVADSLKVVPSFLNKR